MPGEGQEKKGPPTKNQDEEGWEPDEDTQEE